MMCSYFGVVLSHNQEFRERVTQKHVMGDSCSCTPTRPAQTICQQTISQHSFSHNVKTYRSINRTLSLKKCYELRLSWPRRWNHIPSLRQQLAVPESSLSSPLILWWLQLIAVTATVGTEPIVACRLLPTSTPVAAALWAIDWDIKLYRYCNVLTDCCIPLW